MLDSPGEDTYLVPDQSRPSGRLVEELLANGTGPGGDLTPADLSRALGKRRSEAKQTNGQYSQSTFHKIFGSSKYVTPAVRCVILFVERPVQLEHPADDLWGLGEGPTADVA